jgi:hypothetical protein
LLKLPPSTPSSDRNGEPETPAVAYEDKRTITVLIAYAPKNRLYLENVLFLLRALNSQLSHAGEKWHDLEIIVQLYDVTTDLNNITDTVNSANPFQPYQLIILLLSREFVGLDFCYSKQMEAVFKDSQVGKKLLCVLLNVCTLKGYPFSILPQSCYLPGAQRPVSAGSGRRDRMYQEIADGIERAIDYLQMR